MEIKSKDELKELMLDFFQDNPIIFLKFTNNEEWANDILDGRLYMNTLKYFRDLENDMGIKGQGDKNEGVLTLRPESLKLIPQNGGKALELKPSYARMKYNDDDDIYVYCMMDITMNDIEIVEFSQENNKVHVTLKLKFQCSDIKNIREDFGSYAIIIYPGRFLEKVNKKCGEEQIPISYGMVKYREENDNERVDKFMEFSPERFLFKDLDFEYQKEYRLAIKRNTKNSNYFNIDSLRDLAYMVEVDESFNDKLKIELTFYMEE